MTSTARDMATMNEVKGLSVQEEKRLEQLEGVVVENFQTFVQVGQALAEIRDRKLYRVKSWSFEKYCKELFDIAKSRVYQLIDAADVVQNVHNCGRFGEEGLLLPLNESQVRPLTRLRPEQQAAVWQTAIESAPKGHVTASHVNKVVRQYLGEKREKAGRKARETVQREADPDFLAAFEAFSQQIILARRSNYKDTSKDLILIALTQLKAEVAAEDAPDMMVAE